jgi:two-component system sensor histidine kinase KdpD
LNDDVSERAQPETVDAALRRADELKNTFLRTLSHDVRSPLTAVLSAAKLLEDGERLTPEQRAEFSRMIVRNAHRIRRLLDDVLDVERLTEGDGFVPERERIDVETIVRAVIGELNTSGRQIEIDCDVSSLDADPVLFERTVYNLIGNALKHADGEIAVRTSRADAGVVLAVDDRGPGVDDDRKAEIFEPFTRATEEHVPGTGIGLSLVAAFAGAHGGRAWVEDREGGGSSFRVFFPDSDG